MSDRLMTETKSRTANRSDKINKRTVTAAHPEAGRYVVWDTELKGFALRVEPSGAKSYLVRYRVTGGAGYGQRQITLGRHGPLTPDEA
ncbi:MAG: Arm DNA-binding domain-containing protein, partial [Dongiaceae bacterium]